MLKRLLCFLSIFVLLLVSCSVAVEACLYYDGTDVTYEDACKDIRYWHQGQVPQYYGAIDPKNPNSGTIAGDSCNHHAMMYALIKMGLMDPKKGDDIMTHIKKAREHDAFRNGLNGWGYYEYRKSGEIYPGIKYLEEYHDDIYMTWDKGLEYVKGLINKGYYVCACMSTASGAGHLIFFDGVREDGKMSIGDSACSGLTYEDIYEGHTMIYLEVMEYKDKPCNEQPSIYDDTAMRSSLSDTTLTSEEKTELEEEIKKENIRFETIVNEMDLTGMPERSKLCDNPVCPHLPTDMEVEMMSYRYKKSLEAIKDNKEAESVPPERILSICISFVGIIFMVYGVLLSLAVMFDRVNNILDFSLVSIFTFGKVRLVDKNDVLSKDQLKHGYTSVKAVVIRCVLLFAVGALFISGLIPIMIMKIVGNIF